MEPQLYKARFLRKPDINNENEMPGRSIDYANTRHSKIQHAERIRPTQNEEIAAPKTLFNQRLMTVRDARTKDYDRIFKLTNSSSKKYSAGQQHTSPPIEQEEMELEQGSNSLSDSHDQLSSSESHARRRIASRFRPTHTEEPQRSHSSRDHGSGNSFQISDSMLQRPETAGSIQSTKDSSFTLRALELDNLFIRQCIQDLETRIAAQEDIHHATFANETLKAREIEMEELKKRQQWLEKAAEAPLQPETIQQREIIDGSLARIARRIGLLEKDFYGKTKLEHLKFQDIMKTLHSIAINPIFLIIASCLLVVLALYIHMIYFDDDERQIRKKLGPDLYRTGWMEYSMRVF